MKDIVVVGAGGCAREIVWLIEENNKCKEEWKLLGYVCREQPGTWIDGYEVLGDDNWLCRYPDELSVVCGIGDGRTRRKIIEKIKGNPNLSFPNLISRKAHVSQRISWGMGNVVCAHDVMTVDVQIGSFNIINFDCTVAHDVVLEDYVTLNSSVNLSGNVTVGSETLVGVGSKIIQGVTVGKNVTVGAGAVVIKDLPDQCVAVGVPAKPVKWKGGK